MNNNYGLVYPAASDYYDVSVTNSNFSKLADSIDDVKSGGLKKEIVVAAYNSLNPYKEVSDYICTGEDDSDVLASAVADCCEGGVIVLLDGDYYLSSTVTVNKSVTLWGYGTNTRFVQADEFNGYTMLMLTKANTTVKEISFEDSEKAAGGIHFISTSATSVSLGDCSFIINRNDTGNLVAPLYTEASRCRVLVVGCNVRKHDDGKYFIQGEDTVVYGVVMGNYCECTDTDGELSISINVKNAASAIRLKCGAQNTEIYVKGSIYNG